MSTSQTRQQVQGWPEPTLYVSRACVFWECMAQLENGERCFSAMPFSAIIVVVVNVDIVNIIIIVSIRHSSSSVIIIIIVIIIVIDIITIFDVVIIISFSTQPELTLVTPL